MFSRRTEIIIVAAALAVYAAGFFLFYPAVMTNTDESCYIRLGNAFAHGRLAVAEADPFSAGVRETVPGFYAPGTSLAMAPFIWAFGWRGAYLLPLLCAGAAVILLGKWLDEQGASRLFSLALLGYPSLLILGRVGNADVPSAAAVTAALWLFWRGADRGWGWWLLSGLMASLSLLFRETNAVLFMFFFPGALVRKDPRSWALAAGGLFGLGLFFLAEYMVYGTWFFRSASFGRFQFANIIENAPYYLLATAGFIPGGLAAGIFYRGLRRSEVALTVIGYLVFFLCWTSAVSGGLINQMVLHAPRFALSLTPLLIFALAEALPRWWAGILAALSGKWADRSRLAGRIVVIAWLAGVFALAAAVHPIFARWSASRLDIIEAIRDHTDPGSALVTNGLATSKFVHEVYMDRAILDLDLGPVTKEDIERAGQFHRPVYIVVLYRSDSEFWREKSRRYDSLLQSLEGVITLEKIFDQVVTPTDTLRIWKAEI